MGGEQGGSGQGWAEVRETSAPGDLLGVWRLRGWLGGGRRAVGARGRAAVGDGVTQANNRLHPTPGAHIGWQASRPSGAGEAWPFGYSHLPKFRQGKFGLSRLRKLYNSRQICIPIKVCPMPARDMYHRHARNALMKDGWIITHDPHA